MSYATTMFWDKSIFSYIFQLTKVLIHMANYLILGIMPFTFGSKSTLNCNVIWAIQLNWVLANHYHHASWFSLSPWCQQIICSWRNKDHGQYHHQNCFLAEYFLYQNIYLGFRPLPYCCNTLMGNTNIIFDRLTFCV